MARITTEEISASLREDRTLGRLLERRAAELTDKTFLRFGERDISYREMNQLADAAAGGLTKRGIVAGDRVAMMMANSPDWVALWLGAAKIGAVTVTINTAHKGEGLAYLLEHSRSKLLLADGTLAPQLAPLAPEGRLPDVCLGAYDGGEVLSGAEPLDQLFAPAGGPPPPLTAGPDLPCSILYTSGTTGPPKGCMLPHGQYLAAAYLHAASCGYGADTTVYTCLPLFHVNAQNYSLLSVLAAGGTLALDPKFSASGFWRRLIETRATAFNFIGAMALALWSREPSPEEQEHGARVAFGVPVPPEIWGDWETRFNTRVIYAYGMTENALPTIMNVDDTPVPPHLRGASGMASPTTDVMIADDDDVEVPAGTVGEILTRPKIPFTMALEYVDQPDATLEAFRNFWFHTGDLGYVDGEGYLFWVDRKKDALRRRGEMVSSWEVEKLVASFPGIAACAVVGVPSELTEDDILVAVVCEDDPIDPAALIAFCEERTAKFQVPRYVRLMDELPMTPTQRVEKYRLRREGVAAGTWDAHAAVGDAAATRQS